MYIYSIARPLLACFVFILCAIWYGKTHFYRDPGSVFFNKERAYEQRYSQHRKIEVKQFLDSYASSGISDTQWKAGTNASLCVAFSSVKRQHTQYVEVRKVCRSEAPPLVEN